MCCACLFVAGNNRQVDEMHAVGERSNVCNTIVAALRWMPRLVKIMCIVAAISAKAGAHELFRRCGVGFMQHDLAAIGKRLH